MSERNARALDGAADYIEAHGWAQGNFFKADGSVCMVGALMKSREELIGRGLYVPEIDVLIHAVRTVRPEIGETCEARWNDKPGRDVQEVLDVLRAAAKWELEQS